MVTKVNNSEIGKAFSDHADFYKKGNQMTSMVAKFGLEKLPPIDANSVVHDNASGPGVCTFVITNSFDNNINAIPRIYGTDFAQGMIDQFQAELERRQLGDKVSAQVMNSTSLSFEDNKFTHVFMNAAISMADEIAVKMAGEIYRTLQPGGAACVTSWSKSGVGLVENVSKRIRPDLPPVIVIAPEWSTKEKLVETLVAGGFAASNIEVHHIDVECDFGTEDARLAYFCHPFWDLWKKGWSDEEKTKWNKVMEEELIEYFGRGSMVRGSSWVGIAKK
ncbi:uncharacterized protein PV09_08025 [Verruconis gallopava]|uniref:Methyltransferase domain-containing protein n=1 Tax=Verruconis gallopava TaxID=253628 RepID=A0A0D2A2G3_9PEZI|nr:uncharacterized protein PV09_08025 [Verruconis gallopava]KIW00505.1 hypothetical protein PV09_08025 [Verruconis gallopava]